MFLVFQDHSIGKILVKEKSTLSFIVPSQILSFEKKITKTSNYDIIFLMSLVFQDHSIGKILVKEIILMACNCLNGWIKLYV